MRFLMLMYPSDKAETGAMPEARRMLDVGQCATPVPVRANSAMPASSSRTQCACHACGTAQPSGNPAQPSGAPAAKISTMP